MVNRVFGESDGALIINPEDGYIELDTHSGEKLSEPEQFFDTLAESVQLGFAG